MEYLGDRFSKFTKSSKSNHPLENNDPLAFRTIKTVKLDFLTKEAEAPIPRCQDLPPYAFSKLTGKSILVSISHGWFFQTHPDPYGEKLELIKKVYGPLLRKRYPHTDIQVFFDFLASPQRPRTDAEDEIFCTAMDRMNSMYVLFEREALLYIPRILRVSPYHHSRFIQSNTPTLKHQTGTFTLTFVSFSTTRIRAWT